jgi:hypothetical protein
LLEFTNVSTQGGTGPHDLKEDYLMFRFVIIFILALTTFIPLVAQDTVHIKTGWNLIGSVKAGAIPQVLITVPDSIITSTYWGYISGVGYQPTDTLDNGAGYWVKANADGIIVFNNAPPVDSCKSQAFIFHGKLYHTVKIGNQCWMGDPGCGDDGHRADHSN